MTSHSSPTRRRSTLSTTTTPSITKSYLYLSPPDNGMRDTTINIATAFSKAGQQRPSQQKYTTASPLRSISNQLPSRRYSSNDMTDLFPSSKQSSSLLHQATQKNSYSIGSGLDKSNLDDTDDSDDNPFDEEEQLVQDPIKEQVRRRQHQDLRRWSSYGDQRYSSPHQQQPLSATPSFHSLGSPKGVKNNDNNNDDAYPHGRPLAASHPRIQLALKTTADMVLFWIFCVFWAIKEMTVYLVTLVCIIICTVLLNPILFVLHCIGFRSLVPLKLPYLKSPFRGSYTKLWMGSILMMIVSFGLYCYSPALLDTKLSSFHWKISPSRTTTGQRFDSTMVDRFNELEATVNELVKHMEQQDQHNEHQMSSINWHLDQLQHQLTQWSTVQSNHLVSSLNDHMERVDKVLASTTMEWSDRLAQWESQLENRIRQTEKENEGVSPDLVDALRHIFLLKSDNNNDWTTFMQQHQDDLGKWYQDIMDEWIQDRRQQDNWVDKDTLMAEVMRTAATKATAKEVTKATRQTIQGWIDTALEKYHQGADYALATHGATILPLWTSSTFSPNEQQHWWTRWYSLPSPVSSPKMALTPGMHAGQCWPMNGNHGSLGIRLSEPTVVRAVSVDYPGHQVFASQVSSAPKQMELWGLVHLDDMNDAVFLGSFTYQINKSSPRQTFDLDNAQSLVFPGVVLRIRSNWGNQQHTCLYHISVHGTPSP